MIYCPRCGVQVESFRKECPMCQQELPNIEVEAQDLPLYPTPSSDRLSRIFATSAQKRLTAFLIVLAVFLVPGAVTAIVDFLYTPGSLSWSLYPLLSFAGVVILVGLGLLFFRNFPVLIATWTMTLAGYLWALDGIMPGKPWFIPLGLGILGLNLVFFLLGYIVVKLEKKQRGYQTAGFLVLLVGLYLLLMDFMIGFFVLGRLQTFWGIITLMALVPPSMVLLALHFVLRKRMNWERVFHI